MRLAVQEGKGCTVFKLNDKNVEGDVIVTQEDMETWKRQTPDGKF